MQPEIDFCKNTIMCVQTNGDSVLMKQEWDGGTDLVVKNRHTKLIGQGLKSEHMKQIRDVLCDFGMIVVLNLEDNSIGFRRCSIL